jgi:hypothetical protein
MIPDAVPQAASQELAPLAAGGRSEAAALLSARERSVCNGVSPWLSPAAMVLTQDMALPAFFGRV